MYICLNIQFKIEIMIEVQELLDYGFKVEFASAKELKSETDCLFLVRETTPNMLTLTSSPIPIPSKNSTLEEFLKSNEDWTRDRSAEVYFLEVDDSIKFTSEELSDFMRWVTGIEKRCKSGELKSNIQ